MKNIRLSKVMGHCAVTLTLILIPSSLVFAQAKDAQADKKKVDIKKVLKDASAVCLVEITELTDRDSRPVDGNFDVIVKFKVIKGSGKPPREFRLIKAFGGLRPPGAPEPQLPTKLKHDSLKKGEKHWFVFSEKYDAKKYPYPVAGWWPEKAKDIPAEVIKAANKRKRKKK